MKTNTELVDWASSVLKSVEFVVDGHGYAFDIRHSHGGVFMQATYIDADTYSGMREKQYTRKWLVSPAATKSELVQTAFKLCLTSMEHRTREGFKYKGARVFGPHFDVDDLAILCSARENAGARSEPETPQRQ